MADVEVHNELKGTKVAVEPVNNDHHGETNVARAYSDQATVENSSRLRVRTRVASDIMHSGVLTMASDCSILLSC